MYYKIEYYLKEEGLNSSDLRMIHFLDPIDLNKWVIKNFDNIIIPEYWKEIPGHNGRYKVSNHGRIRSYSKRSKGKILKAYLNKFGYLRIELYDKKHTNKRFRKEDGKYTKNNRSKRLLHVLIAKEFCPNPNPEIFNEVDHINGISDDCPFWNLRWIDRDGNQKNKKNVIDKTMDAGECPF